MTKTPEARQRYLKLRIGVLTALLGVGSLLILQKAWELQVHRAEELREAAEGQNQRDITLAPRRGGIYDRDGAELAVSIDVDSVWVSPAAMRQAKQDTSEAAHKLSELLGLDAKSFAEKFEKGRGFVWVKRRVTAAEGQAVRSLKLAGVFISKESRRFYPNRELASHLLGFANADGAGIEGLELKLEGELHGPSRPTPAIFDRRGAVVFSQQLLDQRAAQGNDVTLTIDKTIQHIADRELELAVQTYEARAGSLVALDPTTGEVLAISNYPTFNPNEPTRSPSASRRNRAVTDKYEPGSTLKPFTLAGAFAAGAIGTTKTIDCENGVWRVGPDTIRDAHRFQMLTPAEILVHSSNIGTAKIGIELGRPGLHRALTRFGFGEPTGLNLPGETTGSLRHYKRWYDLDAATIAFGQGMSASTMQLAMALGAIANQGRLMEPILVKRIVDPQGQVVQQALPQVRRQVVPQSVARLVTDMLIGVTGEGGTGKEAAIDGYLVAGKTGTAQKADPVRGGYSKDKWSSSFIGYAPANKPRLLLAVVLDEPMIAHQGGLTAAPVFRRVMQASLRHLGVPAESNSTLAEQVRARQRPLAQVPPSLAAAEGTGNGLPWPLLAAGPMQPKAATRANAPAAPGRGESLVPNLVGQTARAALTLARKSEFAVRIVGSGVVARQDPIAQSHVVRGSQLTLHLRPPSDVEPGDTVPSLPAPKIGPEFSDAKSVLSPTPSPIASAARGGRDG
ncbi:MAG TPA: penicillin-binding transpeptidase domain-containing protein [Polyangiales bacterium]|jgi:cell division protein FtsI (penicillin-binding protein 3)|nr:penicillin-binding transpeptidase domain-containing protein [Polyangiales bacterium]